MKYKRAYIEIDTANKLSTTRYWNGDKRFKWILCSPNGQILAFGNVYDSLKSCRNNINRLFGDTYPVYTAKGLDNLR